MGENAKATISLGYFFENDAFVLPWDGEFCGDYEEWWRHKMGYKEPFNPYDSNGNYKNGYDENSPEVSEYFRHRREWMDENPFPAELVPVGYNGEGGVIVACAAFSVDWEPEALDLMHLASDKDLEERKLQEFVNDFMNVDTEALDVHCQWHLSVFYG